jgi:hypothetical protein
MKTPCANIRKVWIKRIALVFFFALVFAFLSTGPAFSKSVTLGNVTITYLSSAYLGGRTQYRYNITSNPQGQYWILEMSSGISEDDLVPAANHEWVETPIRGVKVTIVSTNDQSIVQLYGQWSVATGDVGASDYLGVFRSQSDALEGPGEARLTWQNGPWTVNQGDLVDFEVLLERKQPLSGNWVPWPSEQVTFKILLGGSPVDTLYDSTDGNGIAEILNYDTSDLDPDVYSVEASAPTSDPTPNPVYQTLTVIGNTPPVAVDDSYGPITELQTLHESSPGILWNDTDADSDPLTVYRVNGSTGNVGSQITLSSGALLTVLSTGEFIYDPNGAFWDLQQDEPDSDSFTYTAYDGTDESNTATVTINITGVATLVLTAVPDTVDFGSIPGPGSYSESSSHLDLTSDDNWSVSENILWSDPGTSFPTGANQATVQKVFSLDYNPKTGSPGQSINISVIYYLDIEGSDMPGLPLGSYSIVVLYTATHTGP